MQDATTSQQRDEVWDAVVRFVRFIGQRACNEYLVVAAGLLIGLSGALLHLLITPPFYSATAVLGPGRLSIASRSGGLQSELSSLTGAEHKNLTEFDKFRATLTSSLLAEHLKKNDQLLKTLYGRTWNIETHSWIYPAGIKADIRNAVSNFLDRPTWHPPGDVQIARALQKHLSVDYDRLTGLLTLKFTANSPAAAQTLLKVVIEGSDTLVRRQSQYDAEQYVNYAAQKLRTVANSQLRAALMNAEQENESVLIFAGVNVPFSVTVIDPPRASTWPDGPSVPVTIGVGAMIGLIVGLMLALVWPDRWSVTAPIRARSLRWF